MRQTFTGSAPGFTRGRPLVLNLAAGAASGALEIGACRAAFESASGSAAAPQASARSARLRQRQQPNPARR